MKLFNSWTRLFGDMSIPDYFYVDWHIPKLSRLSVYDYERNWVTRYCAHNHWIVITVSQKYNLKDRPKKLYMLFNS